MTRPILECVPNFSEGRDQRVLDRISRSIRSVAGVYLLGRESDPDHNRAVFTFAGDPEAVVRAAYRSVATAVESIDLQQHEGVHPRMGAADVVPLVPISGISLEEAAELSRGLGRRIGNDLDLPVFLYASSASHPVRTELAEIRRGGVEGLAHRMNTHPDWAPDFGPVTPHSQAGAVAVGARTFLIAFNVNLDSTDLDLARQIAREVRESSGGLPGVKALGMALTTRRQVQVSMNLIDHRRTGLRDAFRAVAIRAARAGVTGVEGELIGLVPREAAIDVIQKELLLSGFGPGRIIENRLAGLAAADPFGSIHPFAEAIASAHPAPGGGSAAAASASLAASVAIKVARISMRGKDHSLPPDLVGTLESLADELLGLAREDASTFARLASLWKGTVNLDGRSKRRLLARRTEDAARVPARVASGLVSLLTHLQILARSGSPSLLPDVKVAAELARGALSASAILASISETPYREVAQSELNQGQKILVEIEQELNNRDHPST